jgi:ParB family chromosome partitioning protein
MMKKKGGLGRGLGSLIPQGPVGGEAEEASHPSTAGAYAPAAGEAARPLHVAATEAPVDRISPNPRQPRQAMDENALEDLAASIREHGVLQPLLVTESGRLGSYTLVAGERRWRAAMLAGLEMVPVLVKEATPRGLLEMALVENVQRADLNPLEEAEAYRSLVEEFGLTQEDTAARVGKSRQAVANSLRLLRLPEPVKAALASGQISEGHARAILQAPGEEAQVWLAQRAAEHGLSVRQVEALARKLAERANAPEEEKPRDESPLYDEVRHLEDRFRDVLGTKVQLSRSSRGGRLTIYFYSDEELDRIFEAIVGEEE